MVNNWRKKVDPIIKDHLEVQIKETSRYKAYKLAKNPANAQLWIAIANLSRQLFDLNLKYNFLEKTLRDILRTKEEKSVDITKQILNAVPVNNTKKKTKIKKKKRK